MERNFDLETMLRKGRRKLAILRLISKSEDPIGSTDISDKMGIAQSNAVRVLNELELRGAIRRATTRKRDRLYVITEKGILSLASTNHS